MKILEILQEFAASFCDKVPESKDFTVLFQITGQNESYTVQVKEGAANILEERPEGEYFICETTEDCLQQIYRGELTAFTASAKGLVSDSAPLDWKLDRFDPRQMEDEMKDLYFFIMHFFHTSEPEKIQLQEEFARRIHGGKAVPLFYDPGFRSSWYVLNKGEQLNEPGEHDPWDQGIIIIKGEGRAKIGDRTVDIKKNEAYYLPPNQDQVIWNEQTEPLELIWLAWGTGA